MKVKKIIKTMAINIFALIVAGLGGLTYFVGNQVADGLVYQNRGKDTRKASLNQLSFMAFLWELLLLVFMEVVNMAQKM